LSYGRGHSPANYSNLDSTYKSLYLKSLDKVISKFCVLTNSKMGLKNLRIRKGLFKSNPFSLSNSNTLQNSTFNNEYNSKQLEDPGNEQSINKNEKCLNSFESMNSLTNQNKNKNATNKKNNRSLLSANFRSLEKELSSNKQNQMQELLRDNRRRFISNMHNENKSIHRYQKSKNNDLLLNSQISSLLNSPKEYGEIAKDNKIKLINIYINTGKNIAKSSNRKFKLNMKKLHSLSLKEQSKISNVSDYIRTDIKNIVRKASNSEFENIENKNLSDYSNKSPSKIKTTNNKIETTGVLSLDNFVLLNQNSDYSDDKINANNRSNSKCNSQFLSLASTSSFSLSKQIKLDLNSIVKQSQSLGTINIKASIFDINDFLIRPNLFKYTLNCSVNSPQIMLNNLYNQILS